MNYDLFLACLDEQARGSTGGNGEASNTQVSATVGSFELLSDLLPARLFRIMNDSTDGQLGTDIV